MESRNVSDSLGGQRYQSMFCIFLLALVFLYRENSQIIYPQIMFLLALLLAFNLGAGWVLGRWGHRQIAAVNVVIGNCAIITAILAHSGGSESVFWVLYLLPIYTVCLLLNGMHLILIVAGIIGFNLLFEGLQSDRVYSSVAIFNVGLKAGLFVFASAVTWKIAQRDRRSAEKIGTQRAEMERMEKKLEDQQGNLLEIQQVADVEQLAAGIAHDLKNPIAVIFGTAKMMLEDKNIERYKADVERIVRSAELCSTIMSNVSNMTRQKIDEDTSCDLNQVIEMCLQIYSPTLTQAGIHVEDERIANLPRIHANPVLLERVILNLMSNAKAAMKQGGSLRLRTLTTPAGSGACWVQLMVEDTGPGLAPEILARIFKPFNTSKAPGEGTGLGLYLSQQIAQKHHGRLTVENRKEGGARFILSLPCRITENVEEKLLSKTV